MTRSLSCVFLALLLTYQFGQLDKANWRADTPRYIDYDREMAFVATRTTPGTGFEILGAARAVADPDNVTAEFAIIVRSDLKGQGLGHLLLEKLLGYCKDRGTQNIVGAAFSFNEDMLGLARSFGFKVGASGNGNISRLQLALHESHQG